MPLKKFIIFGIETGTIMAKNIYSAVRKYSDMLIKDMTIDDVIMPSIETCDGVIFGVIICIVNIGTEEEPISYERHPIYICEEVDYGRLPRSITEN